MAGIRGPKWKDNKRAGRRQSYRTGATRGEAVIVSPAFFDLLRDECYRWLGHLAEEDDLDAHLRAMPDWVRCLPLGKMGNDDAVRVGAAILGIGERSFYRGLTAIG